MGLIDRLKRVVLRVLGLRQRDWSREFPDSIEQSEPAEEPVDAPNDESVASENVGCEDATDTGTEPNPNPGESSRSYSGDSLSPTSTNITERSPEPEAAKREEPAESDEPEKEPETADAEEATGLRSGEEAKESGAEGMAEAPDGLETNGAISKSPRAEDTDSTAASTAVDAENDSVAEESEREVDLSETGFEFGKSHDEPATAEQDTDEETNKGHSPEPADAGGAESPEEPTGPEDSVPIEGTISKESTPEEPTPASETSGDKEELVSGEVDEEADKQQDDDGPGEDDGAEVKDGNPIPQAEWDGTVDESSAPEEPDIDFDILEGDSDSVESPSDDLEDRPAVASGADEETTEESETEPESSSSSPTVKRRIPYAFDPEGNEIHIDNAEEGMPYICRECEGPLDLRTGESTRNYFAHEWGWLDEHDCSLGTSSQSSSEDEIGAETEAVQRQLPVFFGHSTRSVIRLFGEIPALEINDFDDPSDIPSDLEQIQTDTQGASEQPRPDWFSPANSRVDVGLDPEVDEYHITVDSDERFAALDGDWQADGLTPGDVFVGEKARARRVKSASSVIETGQWVYVVVNNPPEDVPECVEIYQSGMRDVIGTEVTDETLEFLQDYTDVQGSGESTFDADVLLPADVHPRSDAVYDEPETEVLVGIQPRGESDPTFQIIVPGDKDQNTVIDPVETGAPRFYTTEIPADGSERRDIYGLGESRTIELVSRSDQDETVRSWKDDPTISVNVDDGETLLLDPTTDGTHTFGPDADADAIAGSIEFEVPEGYRFDIRAEFPEDVDFATVIRRSEVTTEEARTAISTWIREDCDRIEIDFDAAGKTVLIFDRELNYRVVLEAAVTIWDVDDEEEAINIAVPKVGRMLSPDLSYVEIDAPDKSCPSCGEEHEHAFIAAETALVRLELSMNVFGVENTVHAEKIAKKEIGKRLHNIALKTVDVERLS